MIIGNRLKELRLLKGLNQQELGDLIGVTKVSIFGYENGTRTPNLENFKILVDILGTTADYLLGREVSVEVKIEEDKKSISRVSKEDLQIIEEIKKYPDFYSRLLKNSKRYISLINKRII